MARAATKKTTKKRPAKKTSRSAPKKKTVKKAAKKGVKLGPRRTDAAKAQAVQEYLKGGKAEDVAKKYGVSLQSFYAWKRRFEKMATEEGIVQPRVSPSAELDLGLGSVLGAPTSSGSPAPIDLVVPLTTEMDQKLEQVIRLLQEANLGGIWGSDPAGVVSFLVDRMDPQELVAEVIDQHLESLSAFKANLSK